MHKRVLTLGKRGTRRSQKWPPLFTDVVAELLGVETAAAVGRLNRVVKYRT
jgi:hypothetical protein